MELTVRDTGVGIPEAELPRVFERFHRVEGTRSRTHEGSGIGLALTYELVRLHGGTITATSRVDEGSVVHRADPDRARASARGSHRRGADRSHRPRSGRRRSSTKRCAGCQRRSAGDGPRGPSACRRAADEAPAPRERILVVDDNADMRDYLRQLLRDWDVETATDGAAALRGARAPIRRIWSSPT